MHVVLDQRRVRYAVVSADEVRRFAPLPRTVYLVILLKKTLVATTTAPAIAALPFES